MNTSPEINSKAQEVASWSSANRLGLQLVPRISDSELCSVYDNDIFKWSSKNTVSCENTRKGLCGAILTSEHFLFWDKTTWLCFYLKAGPKQCMNHFLWKRVNCRLSAHYLPPRSTLTHFLRTCVSALLAFSGTGTSCLQFPYNPGVVMLVWDCVFFFKARIHHAKID